eukprot:6486199-Amphidinium_carterae.1
MAECHCDGSAQLQLEGKYSVNQTRTPSKRREGPMAHEGARHTKVERLPNTQQPGPRGPHCGFMAIGVSVDVDVDVNVDET